MSAFLRHRWPETLLALLALGAALSFAKPVMAPLVLAFVTALMLAPVHNALRHWGAPSALAALLTLLLALATLAALMMMMRPWVVAVVEDWPRLWRELRLAAIDIRLQLTALLDLQREVMEAISPDTTGSEENSAPSTMPSLMDAAWLAPQLGAQILIFLAGLFFFLQGKEGAYAWAADALGLTPEDFLRAEQRVSLYFGAVTLINAALGIAVALALTAWGLPGAPIWGLIAALANFVIYLGAAMTAVALLLAGTVTYDGAAVLAPAAIFLAINFLEGQFVTPMVIGQRMRLEPLLVFVSLTLWLWLWGPIGGIIAIPLLLWGQALVQIERPATPEAQADPEP